MKCYTHHRFSMMVVAEAETLPSLFITTIAISPSSTGTHLVTMISMLAAKEFIKNKTTISCTRKQKVVDKDLY